MCTASHFPQLHPILKKNFSGPHSESVSSALKPAKRVSGSSVTSEDAGPSVVGAVLEGGHGSWLARGSVFVTLSPKINSANSVFDFNRCYPGYHFAVTACCPCGKFLLIGLKGVDGRGCVAIYNPLISKLVKAIDIPYPVTALELVSSHGGPLSSSKILSKNLHWLFGIVAIGTEEGHLYLLDLRFDGSESPLEAAPSQIEIVPPVLRDVPSMREAVVESNAHIAFELQGSCHEEGVFHFALPDDEIVESFYPSDATITTLLYEPRVASLFVGFAFGQFQIFSLQDMSLVYSSDFPENAAPILRFSFQEPENDPRNFCYLWVAKGSNVTNDDTKRESSEPLILYMFQLAFFKKEILPRTSDSNDKSATSRSQVLYKNFEVCGLRFEHSLGTSMISSMSQCYGSTLLLCSSAEKYTSEFEHQEEGVDHINGDDWLSPSSSLCIFGWLSPKCEKRKERGKLNLIVFDINRWYMAQMPSNFRGNDDDFIFSAYWAFDRAKDVIIDDEVLLGMGVSPGNIQHFASGKKPLPERYLLPSACSFPCHLFTDQSSYQYTLLGHQQQVLNTAAEMKSLCLVNPKQMHDDILASELFSKHTVNQVYTPDMMRENILTTALEHGQISFLLVVVRDLASGHLAACGCTLRSIMDWAWKTVANVKDMIDKLCVPIFDCSCSMLDALVQSQLDFHTTQMSHLKIIFQKLMEYTEDSSDQSKEEMKTKLNVVTLIHQYLKVVQWFISNGLLPEQMDNEETEEEIMSKSGILIYKYSRLRQVFDQRREELNRSDLPDLLLIDGWIEEIGEPLTSRWLKQEGGKMTYPPPSFMTLLDMYYLDCLDVTSKHCLVMYLLMDVLAMFSTLEDEEKTLQPGLYEAQKDRLNNVGLFLHVFSVPVGLIKLTQAFWLLDHKNFEDALSVFLDADTSPPTAAWQERRILQAFLCQDHPAMALKYLSTRHLQVETTEDAKMHITIYIKSRELLKAWNLVQMSSGHHDMNELFSHLFTICQQHSLLDQLLKLPLSSTEENMIIKYLQQSNNADATQILVLFHLQHSRYVEAIKLHSQSKHNRLMRDQSEESRRRNAKLDHIVQSYSNLLPRIEREISFSSSKFTKHPSTVRRVVHKPNTLSGVLHHRPAIGASSHAARLTNMMDRMDETRRNTLPPQMTPFRKKPQKELRNTEAESKFVYPTISESTKRRLSIDIHGVLGRRSSFGRSASIAENSEVSSVIPPHMRDRRNSSLAVASILLQTPPITRRRSSVAQREQDTCFEAMTPHSILKVKQFLKKSRSPSLSAISQNSSRSNSSPVFRRLKTERSSLSFQSNSAEGDTGLIRDAYRDVSDAKRHVTMTAAIRRNAETFETPKKLRFAGLDSSANDSSLLSPIPQLPGVSSLTPVKVEAEDSKDGDEMDVDVTGDNSMHKDAKPEETEQADEFVAKVKDAAIKLDDGRDLNTEEEDESVESDIGDAEVIPLPVLVAHKEPDDLKESKQETYESFESDIGDNAEVMQLPVLDAHQEPDDVQVLKQETSDEDEVICLDSSSDEEPALEGEIPTASTDPQVAESIETVEAVGEPTDEFRLVLSASSEESCELGEISDADPYTPFSDSCRNVEQQTLKSIIPHTEVAQVQQSSVIQQLLPTKQDKEVEEVASEEEKVDLEPEGDAAHEEEVFLNLVSEEEQDDDVATMVLEEAALPKEENDVHDLIDEEEGEMGTLQLSDNEELSEELEDAPVIREDQEVQEELVSPVLEMIEPVTIEASHKDPVPEADAPIPVTKTDAVDIEIPGDVEQGVESAQQSSPGRPEPASEADEPKLDTKTVAVDIKAFGDIEQKVEVMQQSSPGRPEPGPEANEPKPNTKTDAVDLEVFGDVNQDVVDVQQTSLGLTVEVFIPKPEEKESATEAVAPFEKTVEEVKQPVVPSLPTTMTDEAKPSTPVVDRVRGEPTFALSPPTTRRSTRKLSKSSRAPASPKLSSVNDASSRSSRQSGQLKVPEPEFLFSPPTTRKRARRQRTDTTLAADQSMPAVSPPRRSPRRIKASLKFPEVDSDQSSVTTSPPRTPSRSTRKSSRKRESSPEPKTVPVTPSRKTRKKNPTATEKKSAPGTPSRRTNKRDSSPEEKKTSPAPSTRSNQRRGASAKPEVSPQSPSKEAKEFTTPEKTAPSTPSRKTRQSPSRKLQATPTRSSSRVRAKLQLTEQREMASESESQTTNAEPPVPKRTRRKTHQQTSDAISSGTESDLAPTSARRSKRSKSKTNSWSPSQDKTKLIELPPLQEEEENEKKPARGKKTASSSRVTRSSTTNPVRMRRKAKVFTFDE